MELTKPKKKAAREIIEKGLRREMQQSLQQLACLLDDWRRNGSDVKETYYEVYKALTTFDKHVVRRYDSLTGGGYLLVILGQYRDDVIGDEDLAGLLTETQERIKCFLSH